MIEFFILRLIACSLNNDQHRVTGPSSFSSHPKLFEHFNAIVQMKLLSDLFFAAESLSSWLVTSDHVPAPPHSTAPRS